MKLLPRPIRKKLEQISLVVSDVNGVLTRGIHLTYNNYGHAKEVAVFCEKDAPRIKAVVENDIQFAMISGRDCEAVKLRAKELGVPFFFRPEMTKDHDEPLQFIEDTFGILPENILYIGDDWIDLWWKERVAVFATPADAMSECKWGADVVTDARGGEGAVSEVLIHLLQAKGLLPAIIDGYK